MKRQARNIMDPPFFSIIVPTYRRPQALAACLQALAGLDYPHASMEVIVVDDGSPNPPEGVVREVAERLPVRLVLQDHAGPAAARNHGAETARGDVLAFVDDDCRPSPEWLKTLAARLRDTPMGAVTGRTENRLEGNPFARASQVVIAFLYAHYNADPARARFLTSNNVAISAELFRRTGGFDTSFPLAAGEDREFCDRLVEQGHPVVYAADAVVHHAHELTLLSFLRQHFNYGRGAYHFHRLRAQRREGSIQFESVLFYCSLVGHAFKGRGGMEAFGMALMLGLTQIAIGAGFVREALPEFFRSKPE
jgi:GT2 family glycosyltransferase